MVLVCAATRRRSVMTHALTTSVTTAINPDTASVRRNVHQEGFWRTVTSLNERMRTRKARGLRFSSTVTEHTPTTSNTATSGISANGLSAPRNASCSGDEKAGFVDREPSLQYEHFGVGAPRAIHDHPPDANQCRVEIARERGVAVQRRGRG